MKNGARTGLAGWALSICVCFSQPYERTVVSNMSWVKITLKRTHIQGQQKPTEGPNGS